MPDLDNKIECSNDGSPEQVQEQTEVLHYIGDMAQSLAQMAHGVGCHHLSEHLYHAAQKARANL